MDIKASPTNMKIHIASEKQLSVSLHMYLINNLVCRPSSVREESSQLKCASPSNRDKLTILTSHVL